MVKLGIFLASDAKQAEVDQPDGAGHDAFPVEVAALQVLQRGRPQRRERALANRSMWANFWASRCSRQS